MEIDSDAVERGFTDGFKRASIRFQIGPGKVRDYQPQLISVLESYPEGAHSSFLTLFVELWVVAEVARLANGEPRLSVEQIRSFLAHSCDYFNSFKHK